MAGQIDGKVWLKDRIEDERNVGNVFEKKTRRDLDFGLAKK